MARRANGEIVASIERSAAGDGEEARRVHPAIDRFGTTSWRLIGIGIVLAATFWLLAKLWVIVLALAVGVLFARALNPPAEWLRRRGLPPALVAVTVILGFGLLMAGIVASLVPAVTAEFEDLGPTIDNAVDDIEQWLVEDSPFDVSRRDIEDFRDQADDRVSDALSSSSGTLINGTMVVFEVVTALVLAVITSFFIIKDGGRFGRWTASLLPERHRPLATRLAARAWRTLGGYLRGSATLGLIEGTIIGLTVYLVGGNLAVPVAVVTFFAAFIPFAGAIAAGLLAVLVTLVTAGVDGAIVVGIVALIIQQFDNDLLAPIVFGRSLELHPLVVLFSLAGGAALLGPIGAVFAVPVSAVVINVIAEARAASREDRPALDAPSTSPADDAPADDPPDTSS
jgi:predicted PurR-regulated permease PerM